MILWLLGCQQPDLSQEWDLDRLRLLAIRAEPAEPRPGDTVTFTSLSYVPDGASWSSVWLACVEEGCSFDTSVLDGLEDFESMTPEEQAELFAALQEAGFIGFEPGFMPTWTVPEDALEGLSSEETLEGLSATVQVTLATDDDTELVVRRVPVSLATTPNSNPDVASVTVDGREGVTEATVSADQDVALVGNVAELEEYEYVTTEGVIETRTEELEWRWYVDGGELDTGFDFGTAEPEETMESTATWHTPEEPGAYVVHAVVLDGRGGMGWWSVSVTVE